MKKRFQAISSPYLVVTIVATALITVVPFFSFGEFTDNSEPYPTELYALCFDGIDNDGDGFSDLNDPDCPRCFDRIDNDGDGLIDMADPDCPFADRDDLATLTHIDDEPDDQPTFSGGGSFESDGSFGGGGSFGDDDDRDRSVRTSEPINSQGIYVTDGAYTSSGFVGSQGFRSR